MEINDLRLVACAPDRPEQDRGRFNFTPLAADLLSQIVKEQARQNAPMEDYTIFMWDSKLYILRGFFAISSGMRNENDGRVVGSTYPKGIEPLSPGLRGTSCPEWEPREIHCFIENSAEPKSIIFGRAEVRDALNFFPKKTRQY